MEGGIIMDKRNIKISINKAREWYNQGGELKELALSAFTEKEIKEIVLPNSWEEFCEIYHIKPDEWYVDANLDINAFRCGNIYCKDYRNVLPSQQAAKAHLAYMKLHYLRDCYRQGWKPNWRNGNQCKWCIMFDTDTFIVRTGIHYNRFLSFQSKEIVEKFLNNFQELIKLAGDFI